MQGYFIIPPLLYLNNSPEVFGQRLEAIFNRHTIISKACLRDDFKRIKNYFKPFVEICKAYEVESYINSEEASLSVETALNYSFDGVHFKDKFYPYFEPLKTPLAMLKAHNKRCFYSAHSLSCVFDTLKKGIDFVTLSPIFPTPNKGTPLGVEIFNHCEGIEKSRLFALGGIISQAQIDWLKKQGVQGFAARRYFLQ
ncbi:thiamine phosphate synthase [Helicobacter cetorum]|uniref:thiamine phosphate synthase n=1 Tax=Helicobacter cetorum TaxID=138563 RepID=UPI000CF1548A|nr:thiamine phosphate synthase [Helicobacter cetorum]